MDGPAIGGLSLLRCEFADGEELACWEEYMKVFLTGGTGFIGQPLTQSLRMPTRRDWRERPLTIGLFPETLHQSRHATDGLDALFRRSDVVCSH